MTEIFGPESRLKALSYILCFCSVDVNITWSHFLKNVSLKQNVDDADDGRHLHHF